MPARSDTSGLTLAVYVVLDARFTSGLKIAVRLYKAMVPLTATPLGFRTTRQLSSDGADISWLKVTATGWLTATPIALSADLSRSPWAQLNLALRSAIY
jgi:hypothetical protein